MCVHPLHQYSAARAEEGARPGSVLAAPLGENSHQRFSPGQNGIHTDFLWETDDFLWETDDFLYGKLMIFYGKLMIFYGKMMIFYMGK